MKAAGTLKILSMKLHEEYLFHSWCLFLRVLRAMMNSNAFTKLNIFHAFKGIGLNQIKQMYYQILFPIHHYLTYYGESVNSWICAYYRRTAEIGETSSSRLCVRLLIGGTHDKSSSTSRCSTGSSPSAAAFLMFHNVFVSIVFFLLFFLSGEHMFSFQSTHL